MASISGRGGVWVFNGVQSFPSAVFTTLERAEVWIQTNRLTGVLTAYPLDTGIYDWAVDGGYFMPERANQRTPEFIGSFSSASQEHYHYRDGVGARSSGGREVFPQPIPDDDKPETST